MRYDVIEDNLEKPALVRWRRWLQVILLLGFLLSLLIGLGALAAVFVWDGVDDEPAAISEDPVELLQPALIPPNLALLQLTGADVDALVRQASNARERQLAYAIARFDGTLGEARRAAELIRIGQQLLDAGDTTQAVDAFRSARAAAVLVPSLPALERGQILVRSADGLLRAGAVAEAVATAEQAQHVAVQLPDLLPVQRAQIIEAAAPILRQHGTSEQAQRVQELLRNPALDLNRSQIPHRWPELQEPVPIAPELQIAIGERQAAAQRLLDRLQVTGGPNAEPEREAVRQALLREDQLWTDRYARINQPGLTLAHQHWLIQEQRVWLLHKLRIAAGGFGVQLVPEWDGQIEALRLSLQQVTNNLVRVLEAQIAAERDPLAAAALRVEVLRWLAYQSELGFYPDAPLGELAEQLAAAEAELEQLGVAPALPVIYDTDAAHPGFRIARHY